MNAYFLTLVLKDSLEESVRKELLDSMSKKVGGKMDAWGTRDLAYPIKHLTKGFYAHFEFSADPALAKDLDKTLRVEEDIIRYLLVRDDGKVRVAKTVKSEAPMVEKEVRPGRKIISRKSIDGK